VAYVRSSFCACNGCVEVAQNGTEVLVRDSKDPDGHPLRFTAAEWEAFLHGAKAGEFDGLAMNDG
jgi:hypothetical protein